jgi:hypothetical protein
MKTRVSDEAYSPFWFFKRNRLDSKTRQQSIILIDGRQAIDLNDLPSSPYIGIPAVSMQ